MKVTGQFAALLILQGQELLVQTPVCCIGFRQSRRHSIEAVAQARQLRRKVAVDAGTVAALPNLLHCCRQAAEGSQRSLDVEVNQQNQQRAEHDRSYQALGELVPDFEDLVSRVGLDGDRAVVGVADDDRYAIGRRLDGDETDEPCRHSSQRRAFGDR